MKCSLNSMKFGIRLQIFRNYSALRKAHCLCVRKASWSVRSGKRKVLCVSITRQEEEEEKKVEENTVFFIVTTDGAISKHSALQG